MTTKSVVNTPLATLALHKPEVSPLSEFVSPQQISDFDHEKRVRRETFTLFSKPVDTLVLFFKGFVALGLYCIRYLYNNKWFMYCVIPFSIFWLFSRQLSGSHMEYMNMIEFCVEFVVWWTGLGILSSVGLGSGLQSGVLFMYPHIVKVCFTAQSCNSLDFESATDMWFRSPKTAFKCRSTDVQTPSLFGIWCKIILVCFFQSAGTAIGEIPPYWMTKAARLAAIEAGTDVPTEIPEELESNSDWNLVNKGKTFLIWLLNSFGFYGVLLMASFPNIAFDLCGICCGHFLMPFWTFFVATFLGKAIIRNFYQSVIYVLLCSEHYLEGLIMYAQLVLPDAIIEDHEVRRYIEQSRESFKEMSTGQLAESSAITGLNNNADTTYFEISFIWKSFTSILLGMFFLSLISHFAQYYQMTLDMEDSNKLRRRLPAKVRMEISSPSGRLRLPIPTPLKNKTAAKAALGRDAAAAVAAADGITGGLTPLAHPIGSPSTVLYDPFPPGTNVRLKTALKTTSKLPRIDDSAATTGDDSPCNTGGGVSMSATIASSASQLRNLKD